MKTNLFSQKKQLENFTDGQINIIINFLDKYCKEQDCISSAVVFDALKKQFGTISKSRFCNALSAEINTQKRIADFELRRGRNGGIHRKGLFTKHDKLREKDSGRARRKYTKQIYKGPGCVCRTVPTRAVFHSYPYLVLMSVG